MFPAAQYWHRLINNAGKNVTEYPIQLHAQIQKWILNSFSLHCF